MTVLVTIRHGRCGKHNQACNWISTDWFEIFEKFDETVLLVPNSLELSKRILELEISRILLTGGDDISLDFTSSRDIVEFNLLDHAVENNIPVLGVCRGMQLINYYFGGKCANVTNHVGDHQIKHFKLKRNFKVNSYHNFGVSKAQLGQDLIVEAEASDGTIEAICHTKYPFSGVQWHVERPGYCSKLDSWYISRWLKQ